MTSYQESIQAPYVAELTQLSDYEEISEVLRSPKFVQGAFTISAPNFLHQSVSVLDGREHFARRRMEAHLFSQEAIANYRTTKLMPMVDEILHELRATGTDDPVRVNLVELTWHMLARVAATVIGLD